MRSAAPAGAGSPGAGNAAAPVLEGAAALGTAPAPGTSTRHWHHRGVLHKGREHVGITRVLSLTVTSVQECALFKETRQLAG